MSAKLSIRVWSLYEFAVGIALLFFPEQLTSVFGIDEPQEVWIRAVGAVAVSLGVYYWMSAINDAGWFYRASVVGRLGVAALLAYLGAVHGPWQLYLFAGAAFLGAVWTMTALSRT